VENSTCSPSLDSAHVPFDHCASVRAAENRRIRIRLLTDSKHLSDFFANQWGNDAHRIHSADATIYALVQQPEDYGVSSELKDQRTWFRECQEVWQFGTEYYGNIKVSVRGLCSALARDEELFLHGCAFQVGPLGLILSGRSGVGKTTLMEAIREVAASSFKMVNDDWGAVSLSHNSVFYTDARRLHMKYRSVSQLRPSLNPQPFEYPMENYTGDPEDAHARLLVPREDVFGEDQVTDSAPLSAYVVLFRDPQESHVVRRLSKDDLKRIEKGTYSEFYQRHERFLDGSLFLTSQRDVRKHRAKLEQLTESVSAWVVNNVGSPDETARQILEAIEAEA
jgi:hypothetical protein